nr:zinc finger, CCHC-type [Tanacetum cinerariifolium]
MDAAATKHITSSFAKLEKFEGVDFKRWQKKMHFMLSSMSVVYVMTTLMPEDGGENAETSKELWDTLEAKYMAEDATSKKFLDDDVAWWVDSGATVHVCKDRCWFKSYDSLNDGSILHMGNESTALVHERGCVDLRLNIVSDNIGSAFISTSKVNDSILRHARLGHVHFKRMQDMSKDGLILAINMDIEEYEALDKFKVFKTEVEIQQKSLIKRFKTDKGVAINSIIESRDAIFDKQRFSSVPRPNQRSLGFKQKSEINYFDTYALVARISTIRLLIAMASIHNLIIHQIDVKTAFLNGELEEEVYMNRPLGFIMSGNENKVDLTKECFSSRFSMKDIREADVILGIRIKHESNGIAISQSHYVKNVLKKFNYSNYTPVSTPLDTCEKLMPNRGLAHWQAIKRVLKYLKKTMDYRFSGYPSVLEGYTDVSWISNTEDDSSISSWVFLLGGGAISWASKKQTCITGSIIEYEFVALAAASKEAEWLKNLLHKIPLWVKPMAPISINCNSAATLAKAYSQMYNGKSRHLCVRHSKIHELITNGVVSIEFRDEAHVLQIFPRMCLELDGKEDEVANF